MARVTDGVYRPGDRFLSARAIAQAFDISYQTADRLLKRMVDRKLLTRRQGAGTFIAGRSMAPASVRLVFNRRARRAGSFGARLASSLLAALREASIPVSVSYVDATPVVPIDDRQFPVYWDIPVEQITTRSGLILNDRPPAGRAALGFDSISIDDALGGACAAEIVSERVPDNARVFILAGPASDRRSEARIAGFVSIRPASVHHAPSWFRDDAIPLAQTLLAQDPAAIFACNDRLAEAILITCRALGRATPVVIGFDDAPVAEQLHLSTIRIPWDELSRHATQLIRQRLSGERRVATHVLLSPRPVIRLT